jgi:hypothetical protein
MGANPTQAASVLLFFLAFAFIAAGAASGIIWTIVGVGLLAGSIALSLKAKPWEDKES